MAVHSESVTKRKMYVRSHQNPKKTNPLVNKSEVSFMPFHLKPSWTEPQTGISLLSDAINLPSGVEAKGFTLRVSDCGLGLDVKIFWQEDMSVMHILHKCFLTNSRLEYQPYHPELVGFENAFKRLRSKANTRIMSSCVIPLLFKVIPQIDQKLNLAWLNNSSKVLYVRLSGLVDEYAVNED